MESKTGTVSKVKILKFSERPLVFFKLENVNCLIAGHSLNFLADVDNGMDLVVAGNYNNKMQFVVRRYAVIGKTRIMLDFDRLAV